MRFTIAADLASGHYPIITLEDTHKGGGGHAVVAYNLEDDGTGTGGFYIDVWDSNDPFLSRENSSPQSHREREGYNDGTINYGSRIHVTATGQWDLPSTTEDSGQDFHDGSLLTLGIISPTDIPVQPTMPISPGGLLTLIVGVCAIRPRLSTRLAIPC